MAGRAKVLGQVCQSTTSLSLKPSRISVVWDTKHTPSIVWCPVYKVGYYYFFFFVRLSFLFVFFRFLFFFLRFLFALRFLFVLRFLFILRFLFSFFVPPFFFLRFLLLLLRFHHLFPGFSFESRKFRSYCNSRYIFPFSFLFRIRF